MSGILQLPVAAKHRIDWKRLLITLASALLLWAALTYKAVLIAVIAAILFALFFWVSWQVFREGFEAFRRECLAQGITDEEQIEKMFMWEMQKAQCMLRSTFPQTF